MDFVVIDVETANPNIASICQIGIVKYSAGFVVEEWCSLIDPEDWFSPENVFIHGIEPEHVKGHPTLLTAESKLRSLLSNTIVIHHTHFDRVALSRSFQKYELPTLQTQWLDSARVARRAWPEVAQRGYGLANLCEMIGFSFNHHDALEDARAAAQVFLAATKETGLSLADWMKRVDQPINGAASASVTRTGDPEGVLYGEVVVFTGALQIPRSQAADMAAKMGCEVTAGVTKKTTLLIVGDQDVTKLAGHEKSSKHRKAEKLISQGQSIRILKESDFLELI